MSESAKTQASGVQLKPHQVIIRPLVTEKGVHRAERHNAFAFEVHAQANKLDVRQAVEELFNVKVVDVRTQNRLGKARRFRNRQGATRTWKKAIVKLAPDSKIDFF